MSTLLASVGKRYSSFERCTCTGSSDVAGPCRFGPALSVRQQEELSHLTINTAIHDCSPLNQSETQVLVPADPERLALSSEG